MRLRKLAVRVLFEALGSASCWGLCRNGWGVPSLDGLNLVFVVLKHPGFFEKSSLAPDLEHALLYSRWQNGRTGEWEFWIILRLRRSNAHSVATQPGEYAVVWSVDVAEISRRG